MIKLYMEKSNNGLSGITADLNDSECGWFELILGNENLYIDTYTGKDGIERFNAVFLNEKEIINNKERIDFDKKEPDVEWENVLIGTPVRVWDDDPHDKVDRIFIKYCPNRDCPYLVLNNETGNTARYENAELMEVNND